MFHSFGAPYYRHFLFFNYDCPRPVWQQQYTKNRSILFLSASSSCWMPFFVVFKTNGKSIRSQIDLCHNTSTMNKNHRDLPIYQLMIEIDELVVGVTYRCNVLFVANSLHSTHEMPFPFTFPK